MKSTKKKVRHVDVVLKASLKRAYVHYDRDLIVDNKKTYRQISKVNYYSDTLYPSFRASHAKDFFEGNDYMYDPFPEIFDKATLEKEIQRAFIYNPEEYENEFRVRSVKFLNPVYICPKSGIVWMKSNVDWKNMEEAPNHFLIRTLPKDRNEFYVCEEQQYEAYKWIKQK